MVAQPHMRRCDRDQVTQSLGRKKLFGGLKWNGNDNQGTATITFDAKGASQKRTAFAHTRQTDVLNPVGRLLGLTKRTYAASAQLRGWCERNKNRCYIPEWLLAEWGMTVELSYGN